MKDWDRRPDGTVKLCPVLGYATALAPMMGLLKIAYAPGEREFETGGISLQLTMTPVQLRALSAALLKLAHGIEAQDPGTAQ